MFDLTFSLLFHPTVHAGSLIKYVLYGKFKSLLSYQAELELPIQVSRTVDVNLVPQLVAPVYQSIQMY